MTDEFPDRNLDVLHARVASGRPPTPGRPSYQVETHPSQQTGWTRFRILAFPGIGGGVDDMASLDAYVRELIAEHEGIDPQSFGLTIRASEGPTDSNGKPWVR